MNRAFRLIGMTLALALALAALTPRPAAACERCLIAYVCENYDTCYLIQACVQQGPLITHVTQCTVYPWGCQESGENCFWV